MKVWVDYDYDLAAYEVTRSKPRWGGTQVDLDEALLGRLAAAEKEWRAVQDILHQAVEQEELRNPRVPSIRPLASSAAFTSTVMIWSPSAAHGEIVEVSALGEPTGVPVAWPKGGGTSFCQVIASPATTLPDGDYWVDATSLGMGAVLVRGVAVVADEGDLDL